MKILNRIITVTIFSTLMLLTACEKSPKELPKASFTVSPANARAGDTIYFQNTSGGANTFEWDFGDGNGSTKENPSHIYTETDTYTIHLKITNADGSDEAYESVRISNWTTEKNMPTKRWIHSNSVVNGKLYVIGGGYSYGHGALHSVEEYDPVTDTWSTKSEMPTARQALTTSVVDGKIYAIGGGEAPNNNSYGGAESYTTVEEYNPATDIWTTKTPMLTARWGHSMSVVDGKIYIIGGSDSFPFASIPTMDMYDPATDTWAWIGELPRPVIGSAAAVVNGMIYVIGGELSGNGQRVDEYNPVTNTWTPKANMPTYRNDLSCSMLNDKIYVIGGESEGGDYLETVEVYDPATDTWTTGDPMKIPRCGLRTSTVEGKIYAIGGLVGLISTSPVVEVYYE